LLGLANYICCMIKFLRLPVAVLLVLVLVSWGYEGHHAVGFIAERHLSEHAAKEVKKILGSDDMASVSTFADEIRSQQQYKSLGPLHYFNLPGGLTYDQFTERVKNSRDANIYTAIVSAIRDLQNPSSGIAQKNFSLKMLIHFVGDAHQPMHVSHPEDAGGGKTSVVFLKDPTNLHGLWDEGLLDHQKMGYKEFAVKYDDATPGQIKKWQSDSIVTWLWESYQIAEILYKEAEENPNFDEEYYKSHISVVKNRIEKAGIRLAGLLNEIYK